MKVVLIKTVEGLGIVGETKEVKLGYARNWLLPQGLAVLMGDTKAKEAIVNARKEREKVKKEILELKELATKISEKEIIIQAKAGEKGKLFGAVGKDEIAGEIKIDKKQIEMEPIKNVGTHNVTIKIGYGIEAKVKVIIEPVIEKKNPSNK